VISGFRHDVKKLDLRHSGNVGRVVWKFRTDVSEKPIGLILKGPEIQENARSRVSHDTPAAVICA
jgi:hypothetical protein